MSQDYSPSLVTKNLVFCGDAAMKSAAGPATLLYDKVNDNNGTMYNANCVDFDGTDAYVTYGDVTWLDGLTVVSVSCWFYLDGDPPNAAGILVSKDNTLECVVKRSSGNEYSLSINNNHRVFASAPTPAYGEWIHVVYTWNSTGDVRKLYLNGALADTDTGGNQSGNSLADSSAILAIGDRPSHSYEIDGKMADVKLFSKELSAANVKELYDNSKVIIPTQNDGSGAFLSQADLLLWAPLVEGAGSIAYDGSGYVRDGTYTGTSFLTGQTGSPQLVTGYNRPMLFNGSSNYVQVASDGSTDFANQSFTISAWINMPDVTPTADTVIFSYDYTTHSQPYYAMHLRVAGSSGALEFYWNNGSTYVGITKSSPPLTANTWHHIAAVHANGSQQLYIDGAQVASGTDTGTISFYNQEVWIGYSGNFNSGSGGGYWDGLINEAIVYIGTALNASEIKALASRSLLGGSLNSVALLNNANYPMTYVTGASVTGITAKSDAASSLDACNTTKSLVIVEGQRYRVSFRAESISGGLPTFDMVDQINWGLSVAGFGSLAVVEGHNSKEWVSSGAYATGTFVGVWYTQSAAATFNISDFSIVPVGDPLPPDAMTMGSDVAETVSAKSSNAVESTYSYGGTTYKVWTYRSGGTFVVPRDVEVDVVIVGGGGGGGFNVGGGGGAGGLVSETLVAAPGTYTVTVGAGGSGMYSGKSPAGCTSGEDSSVDFAAFSRAWPFPAITTTAVGGGRAGGYSSPGSLSCQTGGSGGGSAHAGSGCAGTAGQGNTGGSGTTGGGQYAGGGGGGAGAAGANAVFSSSMAAGDGGNGKNDFINSSVVETAALLAAALPTVGGGYLAGGGGGSLAWTGTVGAGGLGGGGRGSNYATADGENGQVNTGGGGGGEKDGGSGIVIIRYAVPNPVGYWRNDGNVTWTDLSGNGNNGTVSGSPSDLLFKQGYTASKSTNAGRDNQGFPLKFKNVGAIGFNGSDDEVVIPHASVFDITAALTQEMWFKIDTFSNSGGGNYPTLIAKNAGNYRWFLQNTSYDIHSRFSGLSDLVSNTTFSTGQWYYVALTKDSGGFKWYVNGLLDKEDSQTGAMATNTDNYVIGNWDEGGARAFQGQIANARIYNRALTNAEITQNFAAQANRFQVPRGIVTSGLQLRLDGATYSGSGSTWYDLSGNNYDMTLVGSPTWNSAGYFDFNGSSQFGHHTFASAIGTQTAITTEAWVNADTISGWDSIFDMPNDDYLMALLNGQFSFYDPTHYSGYTVSVGTWYQLVIAYNSAGTSYFYVNGVSVGSFTNTVTKAPTIISIAAGYSSPSTGNEYFDGKIAMLNWYNRQLSASEIAQNFRAKHDRFGI